MSITHGPQIWHCANTYKTRVWADSYDRKALLESLHPGYTVTLTQFDMIGYLYVLSVNQLNIPYETTDHSNRYLRAYNNEHYSHS